MTETPIKFRLILKGEIVGFEEHVNDKQYSCIDIRHTDLKGRIYSLGTPAYTRVFSCQGIIHDRKDCLVCVVDGEEWYRNDLFRDGEGDVCILVRSNDEIEGVVSAWAMRPITPKGYSEATEFTKLGNRYEHPELLEGKDE